jgi:hypothetical protein
MVALHDELCRTYNLENQTGDTYAEAATASVPHEPNGRAPVPSPGTPAE